MNPPPLPTVSFTLRRVIILASCAVAWLTVGSAGIGNTGATPLANRPPSSPAVDIPEVATTTAAVGDVDAATSTQAATLTVTDTTAAPGNPQSTIEAILTDPSQTLPPEQPSQPPTEDTPPPPSSDAERTVGSIEILDECWAVNVCIDRYLWALYQRAPKEDTTKVYERKKVTVRRKGKTRTVTQTFVRLVDEDFTWKDPRAAEKAGKPMADYVIGGMDRGFKLKLFHALHAAEAAGLSPGITSAFRDDYRQSIASGLKAANDRSYHGGSFRGGYGHGLAADIVSVKGGTRDQRWTESEKLWKWIDAHGKEFGIGRPYLDRDPPHVAPIDGKEYADHHNGSRVQHATSGVKKHTRLAAVRSRHGETCQDREIVEGENDLIRDARRRPWRKSASRSALSIRAMKHKKARDAAGKVAQKLRPRIRDHG